MHFIYLFFKRNLFFFKIEKGGNIKYYKSLHFSSYINTTVPSNNHFLFVFFFLVKYKKVLNLLQKVLEQKGKQ